MQRPTGVTVIAVLAIIGGVLGILAGIVVLLGAMALGAVGVAGQVEGAGVLGGLTLIIAIVTLVSSGLSLAFGIGAWQLKPWAWQLGIIAYGLSIAIGLVGIISNPGSIGNYIVSLVVAGVILYYLFTPEVKRAFGRA